MERIKSTELQGANAYFTNFDNRIVFKTNDLSQLKKTVERNLKILLLTKNNVVCAASHLINPLTYDLLSNNKILLEKQMIIPAFRSDKIEIDELFERKKIQPDKKRQYSDFYNEYLKKTVLWDHFENSTWFRESFIRGFESTNSVINQNLKNLSSDQKNKFIEDIKSNEFLDRGSIEKYAQEFDGYSQKIILLYRELLYHISGARVVNCESTLPQENYIDYSLTDMETRKTQLSELQVFWKIFMEIILDSFSANRYPVDVLDSLSFDDIYEMRQPLQHSSFIQDYNNFYKVATKTIKKDNRDDIIYDSQELMLIRESLEKQFKEVFDEQYKIYLNRKSLNHLGNAIKSSTSIGLGFLPLLGNALSLIYSFFFDIKPLWFNLSQFFKTRKSVSDHNAYLKNRELLLNNMIKDFKIHNNTDMIDMIKLLQTTLSEKYMI